MEVDASLLRPVPTLRPQGSLPSMTLRLSSTDSIAGYRLRRYMPIPCVAVLVCAGCTAIARRSAPAAEWGWLVIGIE